MCKQYLEVFHQLNPYFMQEEEVEKGEEDLHGQSTN
jgi:hypothetical protein